MARSQGTLPIDPNHTAYSNPDVLRREATSKRMDWADGGAWCNWRRYVGPAVRGTWHTLDDEQKVAIATDAMERARIAEED